MLLKLAAATAVLPILATAGLASMDWMVVDVREGGPKGTHLVIPVPMAAARMAVAFVPNPPKPPAPPAELREAAPVAAAALSAISEAPDFELVRVEQRDETVVVRKQGSLLRVEVDGSREKVRVNLPLAAARTVLADASRGEVKIATVLNAVSDIDGDFVAVESANGDQVKVWMW